MEFGLTGCSAVAVLKLLGVRCCVRGLLLFLESGDYIPRCLTCPFLQEGQTKYTFSATKEERRINDNLNCKSKNLVYLIECKKCTKQYIGETKRQLHERFGEHDRSIQNHHQLIKPTPVSTHFNQTGHSNDHLL